MEKGKGFQQMQSYNLPNPLISVCNELQFLFQCSNSKPNHLFPQNDQVHTTKKGKIHIDFKH